MTERGGGVFKERKKSGLLYAKAYNVRILIYKTSKYWLNEIAYFCIALVKLKGSKKRRK